MRCCIYGLAFLLMAFVARPSTAMWASASQEDNSQKPQTAEDKEKASLWMTQKLDYSQKVLKGLTEGNFDDVLTHARAMNMLGYLEGWSRADIPGYREQARAFATADRALIRAARQKNLDGATLAYTQLTISCIQCHELIRDAKP